MQVEASVDEADIGQVQVGQQVRFTVRQLSPTRPSPRSSGRSANRPPRPRIGQLLVILDVPQQAPQAADADDRERRLITGRKSMRSASRRGHRFRPRAAIAQEEKARKSLRAPKAPRTSRFVWVVGADPYKPVKRAVRLGLQGRVRRGRGRLKPGEKILMRSKSLRKRKKAEATKRMKAAAQ
jgi:HlyD family secretion protein